MKKVSLILLFLAACQPRAALTIPEKLVWVTSYKGDIDVAPYVQFDKGVDCPYLHGTNAYLQSCGTEGPGCVGNTQCDAGLYYDYANTAMVIAANSLHEGALAHEMLHAWLFGTTGNGDATHSGPQWETMLPAANQLLQDNGY